MLLQFVSPLKYYTINGFFGLALVISTDDAGNNLTIKVLHDVGNTPDNCSFRLKYDDLTNPFNKTIVLLERRVENGQSVIYWNGEVMKNGDVVCSKWTDIKKTMKV